MLYPLAGGPPEFPQGVSNQDRIAGWSPDASASFIFSRNALPAKVYRVQRDTVKRTLPQEIMPLDQAGMSFGINTLQMTRGSLSELQLVEGLK